MVRIYHDLCLNDAVIEALTVKERVSVASSLGYNVIGVSNYINNTSKLSNKDRWVVNLLLGMPLNSRYWGQNIFWSRP